MFVLTIPYQLPCLSSLEFPNGVFWDPYCLLYIRMIYHYVLLSVNRLMTQKFIMLLLIPKILPLSREI